MTRKRFMKLMMGRAGLSRNQVNLLADWLPVLSITVGEKQVKATYRLAWAFYEARASKAVSA